MKMSEQLERSVCIAGAGPGGALLGLLLAKAGVNVLVLEKAKDFSREFRGESLSPDAHTLLEKSGLKDYMESHGYLESKRMDLYENGEHLLRMDIAQSDKEKRTVIEFPQPVLLASIVEESRKYPGYEIRMGVSCKELIHEDGKVVGVVAGNSNETFTVRSQLVVAADGRYSRLRKLANLEADIKPVARDVLWFTMPRPNGWEAETRIKLKGDQQLILLPTYPDRLRAGINIPAGSYKEFRSLGIERLYDIVDELEPLLKTSLREGVKSWSDVALLDIFTAEVPQWSIDGLVLLGDAAHTITPIMGQGIKHALFDARKISDVIVDCLQKNPGKIISRNQLMGYENERKKDVAFTLGFQRRQETLFLLNGNFMTRMRRIFYRTLNNFGFAKRRILKRIYFGGLKSI
jgi:2-polyprenyl-6-methoxyphenol hydroxylase-like FAD-dependent oxidoreductase